MIGQILSHRFKTHVGGNIGKSLLQTLDDIGPDDIVVLELSSFQLEDLPQVGTSPHIALVTNLTANHLDRHGTMDAYGQAKQNIFRFQKPDDVAIFNSACPITSKWAALAPGRVDFFDGSGTGVPPVSSSVSSGRDDAEQAHGRDAHATFALAVPGAHNQANAQAAWAVARQLGIDRQCAQDALKDFAGLPHRLQFVRERDGVKYYNDSKCTTPGGAIVAVESFPPRTAIIIVGGYDKHVSFDQLGVTLARRAKAVVALGATREQIVAAIQKHAGRAPGFTEATPGKMPDTPVVVAAPDFDSAVAAAQSLAAAGDTVLLSPACASWDMFKNYEERGQRFVDLVK
jgi:UDP-N-acetylmuramoylalanine--D-glutamate ligase